MYRTDTSLPSVLLSDLTDQHIPHFHQFCCQIWQTNIYPTSISFVVRSDRPTYTSLPSVLLSDLTDQHIPHFHQFCCQIWQTNIYLTSISFVVRFDRPNKIVYIRWGFISWNYVVWPIFFLTNIFIALKGTHFWFWFVYIRWESPPPWPFSVHWVWISTIMFFIFCIFYILTFLQVCTHVWKKI